MATIKTSKKSQLSADDAKQTRFLRRKSWFTMELQRQQANRYQMALDEAYYDGEQWTMEEMAEVRGRGQNPVVYNEIAPTVDFLIGTERRTRTDFEVLNRHDDSPEADEDAQNKGKLMKYLEDVNRTPFERSQAIDDMFKSGLGWLETVAIGDPSQQPIRTRSESWRNMLHDSLGRSRTAEDWRYQFRFKEVDIDIAEAMMPGKGDLLRKAQVHYDTRQYLDWAGNGGMTGLMPSFDDGLPRKWNTYDADAWINNPRQRVLLIECWASEPYTASEGMGGSVELDQAVKMRKRVAIMTEYDTLIESWSPYNHGRFPFIPIWCYRRKKDGQPYGVPRRHRGPQDSLNKLMSKAHFRLSVNQVRIEEDALNDEVMDMEELRQEVSAPDGILTFAKGALSGHKVEIREGAPLVEPEMRLADYNKVSIRASSGVSGEDRGIEGNSMSGVARRQRKESGSLLTAELFDNIRLARQIEGEITLSLMEQYHTEAFVFSVPGQIKSREYVKINQPHPHDPNQKLNDITARSAQYIIGDQPWEQALSEASFESAMDMLGSLAKVAPQVVISILDIVFEMNPNLPKKGQMLQRIRQATGMPDPDKGPTPEQQQQNQQKQQMAQAQFQAQLAGLQQKVALAKSQGAKLDADAFMAQLEGLYMAAQAAQVIAMAPQLAPVMDELAKSAGFIDKDGPPLIAPMGPADAAAQGQPPQPSQPPQGPMTSQTAPPPAPQPGAPVPPLQGARGALVGHEQGLHTPRPDGIKPGVQ